MAAVKVQVDKKKHLGNVDVQLPVKDISEAAACATICVLLVGAFCVLAYSLFVIMLIATGQNSLGGFKQSYGTDPGCGYMLFVPKNAFKYLRYPGPSIPSLNGNRCPFVIFSDTKETRISFANYSFQPSSNAGVIVAELSDDGDNELKYTKLDYSRGLIAKSPSVIYYTSDGDEKQSWFVIEVSSVESSGSSTGFPGGFSMMPYTKTGVLKNIYPHSASYPMAYIAVFEASSTSQPDRHFTCSPRNSTCCNAISLYQLPTFELGGIASRLTGLNTGGLEVSSEVTVAMMFALPGDFDASASGSTCLLEWNDMDLTTMEFDMDLFY